MALVKSDTMVVCMKFRKFRYTCSSSCVAASPARKNGDDRRQRVQRFRDRKKMEKILAN